MSLRKSLLCVFLPLACLLFAELSLPGGLFRRLFGTASDDPSVRLIEERQGDITRIFVTTTNCLDITITLAAQSRNMRASPALPVTVETRGSRRVELVTLQPLDPKQPWEYHYTDSWRYGGRGGQPDGTAYLLPFETGARHQLFQGYRGSFSHQAGSPNEYAHDWDLAENSIVQAARDGVVVGVRQDSNAHGVGERFNNSSNYVIIRHGDGTYGEYLHLKQNGALVKLGDTVRAGQAIALSGDTGHSSRPHLHFAVFRTIDGNTRETLPVKFQTRDGKIQTLEEGQTY
jgi:murein DD-endopeptidase MepM/ murein hydrolase activator NlpD